MHASIYQITSILVYIMYTSIHRMTSILVYTMYNQYTSLYYRSASHDMLNVNVVSDVGKKGKYMRNCKHKLYVIYLSIHLSMHICIYLSIYLSVYLSNYP